MASVDIGVEVVLSVVDLAGENVGEDTGVEKEDLTN